MGDVCCFCLERVPIRKNRRWAPSRFQPCWTFLRWFFSVFQRQKSPSKVKLDKNDGLCQIFYLHSRKLTWQWKMDPLKMYFLLNMGVFYCYVSLPEGTWRTIPDNKWLITMVSKSPKWGYSPHKWPKWLVNRGDPNHLRVVGWSSK